MAAANTEPFPNDPRLDSHLRNILSWAEQSPLSSGVSYETPPGVSSADVEIAGTPLTVDYGTANLGSSVLLVLEGNVSAADVEAHGALVNTQAGDVTTVLAPLAAVPSLLGVPGLTRISAAEAVRPMLDVSAREIDADVAWGGTPPVYTGLSGRNVVVGIVDSGIDLLHADFRNTLNQTRIKYAWDQTWTGTKPAGFNYGAEWTEAQINSGAAATLRDYDGHGTHVAGIAAGNGRATGNAQLPYKYVGIAPEADLVIVKTNFTDAGIIDGVNYIFQKAAALGKPAVVNLSIATQKGGHDGTYSLDTAISALTGTKKLVAAAAGNYNLLSVHDRVDLASGASTTVPFTVPSYTPSTMSSEYVTIEGWHDGSAGFQVKLQPPGGAATAWIQPGQSTGTVTVNQGTYQVDNDMTTNAKGAMQLKFSVWRNTTTSPHPAQGTWTITIQRLAGTSNGTCHFWVSTWFLDTTSQPMFSTPDPACSIGSPATADGVIATGAYITKKDWVNASGGTSSYGDLTIGALADFSSIGPRRDNIQRPDLVAPGYGIASALSRDAPTSNAYKVLDGVHYMRLGTSQANAHTAGALALKLQENPNLTPTTARQALQSLARRDGFTGTTPNASFGYGKLDVANSALAIEEPIATGHFSLGLAFPNPTSEAVSFTFSLGSEEVRAGKATLRVFDAGGRLVASVPVRARDGVQEVSWDGRMGDQRVAPAGVYFARLEAAGRLSPARKIIRVVP